MRFNPRVVSILGFSFLVATGAACHRIVKQNAASVRNDRSMEIATFHINNAIIIARRDGWVEVRSNYRPAPTLDYDEYFAPREYYRPAEVRAWAIRSRATAESARLGAGNPRVDTLGRSPQNVLITGTSLFGSRSPQSGTYGIATGITQSWTTEMHGCDGSLTARNANYLVTRPQGVPDISFMFTIDSAARVVQSFLSQPAAPSQSSVFELSQLSCVTRPHDFAMPEELHSAPNAPPTEVLAQFVMTSEGQLDTSTVEFHPPLDSGRRNNAIATMQRWRARAYWGGVAVAFRMHQPVIFYDSARADNRTGVSGFPSDSPLRVRADGLLELRPAFGRSSGIDETWHSWFFEASAHAKHPRELFSAADVRIWLAAVNRVLDSAARAPSGPDGPPSYGASETSTAWRLYLGQAAGRRLVTRVSREAGPGSRVSVAMEMTACAADSIVGMSGAENRWSAMMRASDSAMALHPKALVDSTRVYGELEVTCVAKPLDAGRPSRVAREDSIARSLALPHDALVAFIVDRRGSVVRNSIHVMGKWGATDRRRITAAVAQLRYRSGRFGGVAVAQRAHHVILGGSRGQ